MPPKMRKKWIREAVDGLKEKERGRQMHLDSEGTYYPTFSRL